jgi:type I restriction enzyme M protein
VVLKKCRKADDNIVFIDASGEGNFIKEGTQNKLRDEDIMRIVNAYTNRQEIEKYCHIATLAEIEENDYNLNIPRYVDTFEEEEPIDVQQVTDRLKAINTELNKVDEKLAAFCNELNIPTPF